MASNLNKHLRVMIVTVLVLLTVQYELGMAVNLSPALPSLAPFGLSLVRIADALHLAGSTALAHGIMGSLLWLLAVLVLALSLPTKTRSLQVIGTLGFITITLAAAGGILFVLSGFQGDNYSLMMASNFILAYNFYFLELYFLKPASSLQRQ